MKKIKIEMSLAVSFANAGKQHMGTIEVENDISPEELERTVEEIVKANKRLQS